MAKDNEAPNNMVLVQEGDGIHVGDRPGSSIQPSHELTFEGLGNLLQFDKEPVDEEGQGQHVTILHDYVTGANGKPHHKGQVTRLSNLITNYDNNDETRASVLRLVNNGAIRKATSDEITSGTANVTQATETAEVRAERAKRLAAEQELADLKKGLEAGTPINTEKLSKLTDTPPPNKDKKAAVADDDEKVWT